MSAAFTQLLLARPGATIIEIVDHGELEHVDYDGAVRRPPVSAFLKAPERFDEHAPRNRRLRPSENCDQFGREDARGLCLTAPKHFQRR